MQNTIVQYYGPQNKSSCGYCRGRNSSYSHGMHAYIMSPQDYQDLIDRGWRRSGQYCYKPDNQKTCCPSYTIRCNVQEFKMSKSQKKVLKRFNNYLQNGVKDKGGDGTGPANAGSSADSKGQETDASDVPIREEPDIPNIPLREVSELIRKNLVSSESTSMDCAELPIFAGQTAEKRRDAQTTEHQEATRLPCKKAKQMRLERRKLKLAAQGAMPEDVAKSTAKNAEKTLKDYIEYAPENARHKLTVVIVPSNKGATKPVLDLYRKYQSAVHKDPPHKITQKSYERFLVRSPLQLTKTADGPEDGYGSFHQQYWLDDRLIAVGVIDILPYAVSSVYFFYDPDFSFLSLGTYGSLREVHLTNMLCEQTPSLKYYYMGFYIHSCPKMIYKGRLIPSHLLCPEVYTWHLLTDEIREKLDELKYRRFNNDPNAVDSNCFREEEDLDSILIMINQNSIVTYKNYVESESVDQVLDFLRRTLNLELGNVTRSTIVEYGQLVGRNCAHRMLYVHF